MAIISRLSTCSLCEKMIPNGKRICKDCNRQILECSWILTCNCDEDSCMSLCRDCLINTKLNPNLKDILNELP